MYIRAGALRTEGSLVARFAAMAGRGAVLAALSTYLTGCSLLSIKSPEKPLSPLDFNTRIIAHDFSTRFNAGVEQTADDIAAGTKDPAVRMNALRWKIGATGASMGAASQVIPAVSFLDLWSLTEQMRDFLADGPGSSLFGPDQPRAVALAAELTGEVVEAARRLMDPGDFASSQRFVDGFARAYPIENLNFARVSILELWAKDKGVKAKLIDSLGTLPEAMGQTSELLRMYGNSVTSQALWRAQLAAQESGITSQDVSAMVQRLDDRLARLSVMADSTPGLIHGVVRDVSKRADAAWFEMIGAIRAERAALSTTVAAERQAAVAALDQERAAAAVDAARISSQAIRDAGEQVRRLVREALLLVIGLAVVILGLPFAAGYYVGRARHRP